MRHARFFAAAVGIAAAAITAAIGCRSTAPLPAIDDSFAPGYVGSAACASCHEKEFAEWKESLHSRMEQAASPATVIGGFTSEGVTVTCDDKTRSLRAIREGDQYFVEAPDAEGRPTRYAVERTVGNRYKQILLTKFPDGSWHPLPLLWLEKDQKFVEWLKLASGKAGEGHYWTDPDWQWQIKCAGCHTTGLDLAYDTTAKTYSTKWKELAIGCESCHGPGKEHVLAGGGKGNVLCPSNMTHERQIDTCGKCHSRGTAGPEQGAPPGLPARIWYPYNMLPGEKLDDHYTQVAIENPKTAKFFWKDGSSLWHHQQLTDYRKSVMFTHDEDGPHCTTCHEPHRAAALKAPIENNALCVKCHTEFRAAPDLARHTGHGGDPVANAGARCVECHMPRTVDHAGTFKLRSHTYWAPNPAQAKATGSADACLLCHKDKDAAWSSAAAATIWPPRTK